MIRRTALLSALLLLQAAGCADSGDSLPGDGNGKLDDPTEVERAIDVNFSPQPLPDSHVARVAALIAAANETIDIAMYSYSSEAISLALKAAVERGVKVRFLFETGGKDAKLAASAKPNSKSGKLERIGVDVRYVSRILHHKLMIIDGPRDDAEHAATARVVSGSGNWNTGATESDENTLFFSGYPELTNRLQAEFNLLWEHSKDFVLETPKPYELSSNVLDPDLLEEDPALDVYFTTANFDVNPGSTTFRKNGVAAVSGLLVDAINGADTSILIASGHLRSRPVAEALIAKKAEKPEMDIRVYVDGQEFIREWTHDTQVYELEVCLAEAEDSESKRAACLDNGFLFGYQVGEAGIPVRYKYYAYRWDKAYAKQMHHKYLIVDGETLYTGSYNLSDNAEHNTFENMFVFRAPEFAPLIAAYEENFETIWETGRAEGLYDALLEDVSTADPVPLVFPSMALEWEEIGPLKDLIEANCPEIDSEPYRRHAAEHQVCPR